jgi:hypothetical protein
MRASALVIAAAAAVAACDDGADRSAAPPVDRVLAHVAQLEAIGPRPGGSPQAGAAADYIAAQLTALGAPPDRLAVGRVHIPAIRVGGFVDIPPRDVESRDANLIVRFGPGAVPGDLPAAPPLLLLAHYDTVPGSPGAADDAAAVALLLELARELAAEPPRSPVWLAFTADEERGLVGARALAAQLGDQVGLAIALDLVGVDGPLILNGAGDRIRRTELRWLAAAADVAGVDLYAPAPHRIVSRWWPQIERADHGAFTARGVRAVHLFNRGGPGGGRIYLAYHTPRDRADQLSRRALADVVHLLHALAAVPPPPPSAPGSDLGVWLPVPGNLVVPRWAWLVGCGVLALLAALGITTLGRRLSPGPGVVIGIVIWLVASAVAVGAERLVARFAEHPAPWVHAPLRHELALAGILLGAAALGAIAVARRWAWGGPDRWALAAAGWNLVLGGGAVAIGAAELAWVWLVPAAALAWLPRVGATVAGRIAAGVAVVVALAPTAAILDPAFARELVFHGFLPTSLPITAWVAVHGITAALVGAHLAGRIRSWGPGASFAAPVVAVALIAAGALALATASPACTAAELAGAGLACELE